MVRKLINRLKRKNSSLNIGLTSDDILRCMPGHVYWKDKDSNILGCNLKQAVDAGFQTPEEAIGRSYKDIGLGEDVDCIRENDKKVLKSEEPEIFEENGYLSHKSPLKSKSGMIVGLVGVSVKSDEYRKVIERNKKILEDIISIVPGHIYWKDTNCTLLGCNNEQARDTGLKSRYDIVGKSAYDLLEKDQPEENKIKQAAETDRIDKEIMKSGEAKTIEEIVVDPDKSKKIFLSKKIPLRDEEGKVIGLAGISLDITEKKKLERQLIEEKEKSDWANQAKSEFIANMSHDLRTPMTGLLGMLDGLLYAAEDTRISLSAKASSNSPNTKLLLNDMLEKVEEYAGMARNSADKLNQLHNDILDNIELESGESTEVDTPFNLDQLTQTIVGLQKPVAVNKGLDLTAEIESGTPCYLKGLYQSLTRILLNLVGNAIKFTKSGSVSIVIGLGEDEQKSNFQAGDEINLKIQVKDTGMGIPSDKFDEIFGQFSRLTASYEGTHKGLGLGLYVVKKYLDQMKGSISIESKIGGGSCFTLYVPLTIEKEGVAQTREPISEEKSKTEIADEKTITEGLSVLLVEDDKVAAMATKMNLVRLGCDVDWVESGEEALEKVAENDYKLIFTDIGLPNKSGIDIAAEIRELADKQKATVPIVALTGHARGKIRKLCLDVGMQKVLSKPVDIVELEKVLLYFAVN